MTAEMQRQKDGASDADEQQVALMGTAPTDRAALRTEEPTAATAAEGAVGGGVSGTVGSSTVGGAVLLGVGSRLAASAPDDIRTGLLRRPSDEESSASAQGASALPDVGAADAAAAGAAADGEASTDESALTDEEAVADEEALAEEEDALADGEGAGSVLRHSGVFLRSPESARYWKRVLVGDLRRVPEEVRRRAGADEADLSEEERRYRLASAINRSWVADHSTLTREEIAENWGRLRAGMARNMGIIDNEEEFYRAISLREDEEPLRRMASDLYQRAYVAGLDGRSSLETGREMAELPLRRQRAARRIVERGLDEGRLQRERFLPLATRLSEGLKGYHAAESEFFSASDVLSAAPDLFAAADELSEMSEDERHVAYHIAQGLSPDQRSGTAASVMRAARRGALNLGVGAAQGLGHLSAAVLRGVGRGLDERVGTSFGSSAEALDRRLAVHEELRRLAQHEVYPLGRAAGASRMEQYMIDAAEATPGAVLAFSSGAGFAGLTLSGVGESVAEARLRAPEGDRDLQLVAGVIGGAIQAGIYAGMSKLGGRALEQSLAEFARASGSGAAGYSMAALRSLEHMTGEGVRLLLAGKAAAATDLGLQELAARIDGTASHIDWRAYGESVTDIETNMREAAMLLPYVLIGSGRVSLRHFRNRAQVLGDGSPLLGWGISEQQKEAIMRETDPDLQSRMLLEALRGSPRWSSPSFPEEAARALRLLHTEYFDGFSRPEVVRDFLKLPADSAQVKRPELPAPEGDAAAREASLLSRPGVRVEAFRKSKRLSTVLPLWDEWWAKSHLLSARPETPRALQSRLLTEGYRSRLRYEWELMHPEKLVPSRIELSGAYAPNAELERRVVLADRFAEIQDLSYQYLLSSYSLDALTRSVETEAVIRKRAERSRQNLLGLVGDVVLRLASGEEPSKVRAFFRSKFSRSYSRRSSQLSAPEWMRLTPYHLLNHLGDLLHDANRVGLDGQPPELVEAVRVMSGVEANARALFELLPLSPDFVTALSRGMSPVQAYAHLLIRELQLDEKQVEALPPEVRFNEAEPPDQSAYTRENRRLYEVYSRMTGRRLESCTGEDGKSYWRVRRPNGELTHWHQTPDQAINELAAQSSLAFMLYGVPARRLLQEAAARRDFRLSEWLPEPRHEYSAYDRLCSVALRDLSQFWQGSVLRMQPGMDIKPMRYRFRIGTRNVGISPKLQLSREASGGYDVDAYSVATPLALMQARFNTYWMRQLSSESIRADELVRMLGEQHLLSGSQVERISRMVEPRGAARLRGMGPTPAAVERRNRVLGRYLSRISLFYMMTHMDRLSLPSSVREWLSLAPFCRATPEVRINDQSQKRETSIPISGGAPELLRWANRRSMLRLRRYGDVLGKGRELATEMFEPSERLAELLRASLGLDPGTNAEQAWCYHFEDVKGQFNVYQDYVNLLLHPLDAWRHMQPEDQRELRESLALADDSADAAELTTRLGQLEETLRDFPELHSYSQSAGVPGQVHEMLPEPYVETPPSEVEVLPTHLRYGVGGAGGPFRVVNQTLPRVDYRVSESGKLPASLSEDARVMPALRTLDALRSFVVSRPYATEQGIWWRGRRYGGADGAMLPDLSENWLDRPALEGVRSMLARIDAQLAASGQGEMQLCGVRLLPTGEALDLSPWKLVSLYRDPAHPELLYRLMPGEPDAPGVPMRRPYVVNCCHGFYVQNKKRMRVRQAADFCLGVVPLNYFRPFELRFYSDENMASWGREAIAHTLDGIVARAEAMMPLADESGAAGSPDGAMAEAGESFDGSASALGWRELVMRLCEDTSLSYVLAELEPSQMRAGQALALSLAREMILTQAGSDPEAPERLRRLASRLRSCPDLRRLLIDELSNCLERSRAERRRANRASTRGRGGEGA